MPTPPPSLILAVGPVVVSLTSVPPLALGAAVVILATGVATAVVLQTDAGSRLIDSLTRREDRARLTP